MQRYTTACILLLGYTNALTCNEEEGEYGDKSPSATDSDCVYCTLESDEDDDEVEWSCWDSLSLETGTYDDSVKEEFCVNVEAFLKNYASKFYVSFFNQGIELGLAQLKEQGLSVERSFLE